MHQLQNNKLTKLFQDLSCKIDIVHGRNTRHASNNIYFLPREKKCITQTKSIGLRRVKTLTNIDNVYKNKELVPLPSKNIIKNS